MKCISQHVHSGDDTVYLHGKQYLCVREQVHSAQSENVIRSRDFTLAGMQCRKAVCVGTRVCRCTLVVCACSRLIYSEEMQKCSAICAEKKKKLNGEISVRPCRCICKRTNFLQPVFSLDYISLLFLLGVMLVNLLHCQTRPLHGPRQKRET